MKSYRAHRLGGPQALKLEETEEPRPGPGEVLIAVEAMGLQLADLATLAGERPPRPKLPFTPGLEVAGRIAARGTDVKGLKTGSSVVASVPWGGLAERVVARAEACVAIPKSFAMADAAALPFAFAGALMALETRAGLREGQSLLVLGAGGGLGIAAVAIGKALGATVIAVANGANRLAPAKELGADHVLDAGLVAVASAARDLTGGDGVDVVYDPVGGEASSHALPILKPGGHFLIAGFAAGRPQALDIIPLYARGGTLIGANMVLEAQRDPAAAGAALARVVKWVEEGKFAPRVAAQFDFQDIGPAFDYVAGRRGSGAVIVKVGAA
ncbi:MAG TPA: zinc-binding dehydrogenase [Rhizomicrobium sp.]|nr:zinc-binding dehydrogenase [Rhizomicrobium sp.]